MRLAVPWDMNDMLPSLLAAACVLGCAPVGTEGWETGPDGGGPTPTAAGKADGVGPGDDLDWEAIRERCVPPAPDAPHVSYADFGWGLTHEEMAERYEEMIESPRRLLGRAYYDEATDRFLLPLPESWGGPAVMPPEIVASVRRHIEEAMSLGYASFVFFPDMGHAHYLIPQEHWDAHYRGGPVGELADKYGRLMADPELKMLYHTAEQLEMLDESGAVLPDRHVQWRFYTRNPVGANRPDARLEIHRNLDHRANTVREVPGHQYHGSGFYVSAHRDGCFPFRDGDTIRHFDLSLTSIPAE